MKKIPTMKESTASQTRRVVNKLKKGLFLAAATAFPLSLGAQNAPGTILNDETYWIGNTFKDNPNVVNWDIDDIAVTPGGTVYTACNWVESNLKSVSMIVSESGGEPVVEKPGVRGNSLAVALSDNHVFLLSKSTWTDAATNIKYADHYVMRINFDGSKAPFSGADKDGYMRYVSTSVETKADGRDPYDKLAQWPSGMVVSNGKLYVSDPVSKTVKSFNNADSSGSALVPGSSFSLHNGESPRKLAVNSADNRLWVVQRDDASYVYRICAYTMSGAYQSGKDLQLNLGWKPMDIEIANVDGQDRLFVADSGPASRIHRYSNLNGSPVRDSWGLGQSGGVWNSTNGTYGATGNKRFAHPTGIAVDGSGNIYVAQNGFGHHAYDTNPNMPKYQMFAAQVNGSKLTKFSANSNYLWKIEGMMHNETGAPDPDDEDTLHTSLQTYEVNYNLSTGEGPGDPAWTHKAWSFDPFAYPEDPRVVRQSGDAHTARIDGQRILYTMSGTNVCVYRFVGEVAVPAVMILRDHPLTRGYWPANSPQSGSDKRTYLWFDSNGNGLFDPPGVDSWTAIDNDGSWPSWEVDVDAAGNIWIADGTPRSSNDIRLHRFYLPGSGKIDGNGVPKYSHTRVDTWNMRSSAFNGGLTPVGSVRNIAYDKGQDLLIAGIFPDGHPELSDNSVREAFDEVRCYQNLLSGSPSLFFNDFSFPFDSAPGSAESRRFDSHWPECVEIIGDHYFITYDMRAFDEAVGGRRGETLVYQMSDSSYVGAVQPGVFGDDDAIAMDIMHAIQGYQKADGSYLITQRANPYVKTLYYQLDLAPDTGSGDWVTVPYNSGQIAYNGNWQNHSSGRKQTNQAGATASYSFNGTGFMLVGDKTPWGSGMTVYIDGQLVTKDATCYNDPAEYDVGTFGITGLAPGNHTVDIVVNDGGWVYFVEFKHYTGDRDDFTEVPYDDPSINYTGSWQNHGSGRKQSNTAGSIMAFTFTGTDVLLIGDKTPWGGSCTVKVNGQLMTDNAVMEADPAEYSVGIYAIEGLPQGTHTIEAVVNGDGWSYLRAFQYR